MDMELILGWGMAYTLLCAIVFYGIGVHTGQKTGYAKGRSIGIRIGARRELDRAGK